MIRRMSWFPQTIRWIARRLQFKPHAENLLTQSAASWLMRVQILVFLMATAEAVSWGYLGYLFGEGSTRWIGAAFTSMTIFFVVWIVDQSLVTLDLAWDEHSEKILRRAPASKARSSARNVFTIGIRIGVLAVSLFITAPYLAQVVFHNDIAQLTAAEGARAIDDARQTIVKKWDSEIAEKNGEIAQKRREYEAETAGKGLSGRYGEGPAAKAIFQIAATLESERSALQRDRDAELEKFNRLANDWESNREQLASAYNVSLPKASVTQNNKALEELRKRPETIRTERAIQAFLAIIFFGLLLLKLYEPSSVRLYMSEVLQQEYLRYRAGVFDEFLPAGEQSTAEKSSPGFRMSPQALYSFLVDTWVPIQQTENETREEAKRRQKLAEERKRWEFEEEKRRVEQQRIHEEEQRRRAEERLIKEQDRQEAVQALRDRLETEKSALEHLRIQKRETDKEVSSHYEALTRCQTQADERESSLKELQATIQNIKDDIAHFDSEHEAYERQKIEVDEKGVARIEILQTQLRKRRSDAHRGLLTLQQSLIEENIKFVRAGEDLKEAEKRHARAVRRFEELDSQIASIEAQIAKDALSLELNVDPTPERYRKAGNL